ncbi:hypothetical protein I4U23_021838 [Adineta vaga]|nr:hypothetical protein I4U23_021838 [Adineta vaga]
MAATQHHRRWVPTIRKNDQFYLVFISAKAGTGQHDALLIESVMYARPRKQSRVVFNMYDVYQVDTGELLVDDLLTIVDALVERHGILRTRLHFDAYTRSLRQSIRPVMDVRQMYTQQLSIATDADDMTRRIFEEVSNSSMNFEHGHIFRLHLIFQPDSDKSVLRPGDVIILNIHHGVFDGVSFNFLVTELETIAQQSSRTGVMEAMRNKFQYIDYVVHTEIEDESASVAFWKETLANYPGHVPLGLPYDFRLPVHTRRTGMNFRHCKMVDSETVRRMTVYAQEQQLTFHQLMLACYSLFLALLTDRWDNVCVGTIHANRHRSEFESIIGFVAQLVPLCLQLSKATSFTELVQYVHQSFLNVLPYSHYDFANIVYLHRDRLPPQQPLAFIETIMVIRHMDDFAKQTIDLNLCHLVKKETADNGDPFPIDLGVGFFVDPTDNTIVSIFEGSVDRFRQCTIVTMVERFDCLINQLFSTESIFNKEQNSISNLHLILPHEQAIVDGCSSITPVISDTTIIEYLVQQSVLTDDDVILIHSPIALPNVGRPRVILVDLDSEIEDLFKYVHNEGITCILTVPSMTLKWCQVNLADSNVHCFAWLSGAGSPLLRMGAIQQIQYRLAARQCHFFHLYAPPSRCLTAYYEIQTIDNDLTTIVPVGRPLRGCTILNDYGHSTWIGQVGDLNVIDSSHRFDATGDRAMYNEQEMLVYMGCEKQTIEDKFIMETIIAACPTALDCCLGVGNTAAYLLAPADTNLNQVVSYCRHMMCTFQVPAVWFLVSEWPLDENGRLDRARLPADGGWQVPRPSATEELSAVERELRAIFAHIFELPNDIEFDVLAPFMSFIEQLPSSFNNGQPINPGLLSLQAMCLIRERIYPNIDAEMFFGHSSVRELAQSIAAATLIQQ